MTRAANSTKKVDYSEPVDRCSELPECILHIILLFLDPKEACRTTTLSKQWYEAWSSLPVLVFRLRDFYNKANSVSFPSNNEVLEAFVGFIDKTMKRYYENKYSIKKFKLELFKFDEKLKPSVDEWIRIAVEIRVQEFDINIDDSYGTSPHTYTLPETLFRSKYLKVIKCSDVRLPYYKELDLILLENLTLQSSFVDEKMLHRVMSFCPLIYLNIASCYGLQSFPIHLKLSSIPWMSKAHEEVLGIGTMQHSGINISSLKTFIFFDNAMFPWPWKMNFCALSNLTELRISRAHITDGDVSHLTSRLLLLQTLHLSDCSKLKSIKIQSVSLKKLEIERSEEMIEATIDAPNLRYFWFECEMVPKRSIIKRHDLCDGRLSIWGGHPSTECLIKLKKFLIESNIFNRLYINCLSNEKIDVKEDELRNLDIGPTYKIKEMRLQSSGWKLTEASLSAFLDGLFWCCRPDMLVIDSSPRNQTSTMVLEILDKNENCTKHPLKSYKAEVVSMARLLGVGRSDIRCRLFW